MAIIAKESGGSRIPPLDEGVYMAICSQLIDLGLQYSERFDKTARKIMLVWQVIGETVDMNGEIVPRTISKEYATSLHEKSSLRHDLEAWRGRSFTREELDGFNMQNILGKACQLQIIHRKTERGIYQSIAAIMAVPRGMEVPPLEHIIEFDLEDETTYEAYAHLPNYIREKIKGATNYDRFAAQLIIIENRGKPQTADTCEQIPPAAGALFEELTGDDADLPF